MNLPNKLTMGRIILIPLVILSIILAGILIPRDIAYMLAAALFGLISLTDYFDGKIARRRNLITVFGKFLDPLADKLLVIGTMLTILYKFDNIRPYFFWALLIVIFRELMVTGLRLIAVSDGGEVIAANKLGKIKTVTQIVSILVILLEPVLQDIIELFFKSYPMHDIFPLTMLSVAVMTFFTIWSGAVYIFKHRKHLKQ
jgi:CDP-diacylglycerol--glycerol-3-phosphate 3-phosphatidyltransferase